MERATESPTHARLRELAIEVFEIYGYQVYPSGIGVRDTFAMADFLAVRDHRTIFVEVLTDAKATPNDLRQKQQLAQHGELAFVFIGNLKNRKTVALAVQAEAAQTHDVLLGHWGWGKCNHLASAHPFQRFAFILNQGKPLTFCVEVTIATKQIALTFSVASAPYPVSSFGLLSPDPTTAALPAFVNRIASVMATQLHGTWSKPRNRHSILTNTSSAKRLANRLVAGSRESHRSQELSDSLSIILEPATTADAFAATSQVAEEYRLALSWTGATHETVAEYAMSLPITTPEGGSAI